jgi:PEP-CTERM motif
VKGLTMKKMLLAALAIIFASSGAWANSLTYQGVTFTTTSSGNTLTLTITNGLNADPTSNWAGIKYLESFAIGNVGSFTGASVSGFTYDPGGLSNGSSSPDGCNGSGSGWACFYAGSTPLALSNSMTFNIAFTGSPNFSLPSLKIDFWADPSQTKSTGDLLSQSIPVSATPLPGALGLMGLGLAGFAAMLRKRKKDNVPVATA